MKLKFHTDLRRKIAVSALIAVVALVGLWALAQADQQHGRIARLGLEADALTRVTAPPLMSPIGVFCRPPLTAAMADTGERLKSAAAMSGLELEELSFLALPSQPPTDLVGQAFGLSLRGNERQLTSFLKTVSSQRLPVFLDAVEISMSPGVLVAQIHGRLLCKRAA